MLKSNVVLNAIQMLTAGLTAAATTASNCLHIEVSTNMFVLITVMLVT